jgi:RND family efflux transporter MFP subunit
MRRLFTSGSFYCRLLAALLLSGCASEAEKFVPPPPPEVTISQPEQRETVDYLEFTGNTKALESVEIRARVQGFLDKMNFKPGQKVKAGDALFVIDPRPYQAAVDQKKALVKAKEAAYELAKVKADKTASLGKTASVSELTMLEDNAHRDVALAQVGVAKADLEDATLQLDYTEVKSPINGRVDRNLVDLGTLVGAQEKTLLTTVVNDEKVYVYFNLSENDFLMVARAYEAQEGEDKSHRPESLCFLALADETEFKRRGVIDFVGTQLDPKTGTLQLRAVFPNEDGLLKQGLFVKIRVPLRKRSALLVHHVAVGLDQGGRYVLTVNNDNVVERRQVQIGRQEDDKRVIEKGLGADEWVIVNGFQRARPGSKVTPLKESAPRTKGASPSPAPVAGK